ncbi:unnamed protein product [Hydatigera taeniaeformis]|uniref:Uncharacterized protein n=1 Tax=Hydatigena taeniaeformis TaxID=6205 RepID=A0A3P7EVP6_HYDTA|nr:unnamed protein product [Hydatigera taeniaeformis]
MIRLLTASPKPNVSIIFDTPEASPLPIKSFKSSTGDIVQPPFATQFQPSSSTQLYRKPRRSSLVTQRHILVMAKRAAEGRTDILSREGNYDGLNYAPMHQVNLGASSSFSTIASQRAKMMVQMAVSQASQKKPRQMKRVVDDAAENFADRSFVFEDSTETSLQPMKERRPLTLESQEMRALDEVFSDFVKADPGRGVSSEVKKTLGESLVGNVVLEPSFVDALDEEWGDGFDE